MEVEEISVLGVPGTLCVPRQAAVATNLERGWGVGKWGDLYTTGP